MTGFDGWYTAYPNKKARKAAEKAWGQLDPSADVVNTLMAALNAQIRDRVQAEERGEWRASWPHPATWLRGERWQDVIEGAKPEFSQSELEAARHWRFQVWCSLCHHKPICEWDEDCLERIALKRRMA